MSIILIIFYAVMALMVVGTALGMLLSRNAVYSALFLVLNFATVAVLYVMLGAPFIALAQVEVYAGAIMVLFLFVIMLLGAERLGGGEPAPEHRTLALILGGAFLIEATFLIVWMGGGSGLVGMVAKDFASPTEMGLELFNNYSLPFEITSVILLVAVIGAILLTRSEVSKPRALLSKGKEEE